MSGINAVFFDLDNTLCDYWASSRQALTDALEMALQQYPSADREILRQDYNTISREAQRATGPDVLTEYSRVQRFGAVLARHGIDDSALATKLAVLFDQQIIARLELFEDAIPVLEALLGRVYLGIVSNGTSIVQREKIAALGIERYFSSIFISEEIGIAKPDPALFHHVLQMTGVTADQSLYIGDSQDQDVTAAKLCGVTSVWFNRRGRAPDPAHLLPDYTIATLADVLPVLGMPATISSAATNLTPAP